MPGRKIQPLSLSIGDRKELELLIGSKRISGTLVERAKIILHRANGHSQKQTAELLKCSEVTVAKWVSTYRASGLRGLKERRGQTRHKLLPKEVIDRILSLSKTSPEDGRWTVRSMAKVVGVSPSTISRVWREHGITPAPRRTEKKKTPSLPKETHASSNGIYNSSQKRVTQRIIADHLGISPMTVSRALSNQPNVRDTIKKQILDTARELNYRPDPQLRKLMFHLRRQPKSGERGNLCSLEESNWSHRFSHYFRPVVAGARARAEQHGFSWASYSMEEFLQKPACALRILKARGVEGIFLPPAIYACELPPDIDWSGFSVIAATYSITKPAFRRVVPHHFRNMIRVCEKLKDKGYNRLGLVLPREGDSKVGHAYSGGYAAFHAKHRMMPLAPLLYEDGSLENELGKWFDRETPDALIIHASTIGEITVDVLSLEVPGPVAIACVTYPISYWAGMNEHPELVGATAIDQLSSMILHGEQGLPEGTSTIMIDGAWHEGESIQPKV